MSNHFEKKVSKLSPKQKIFAKIKPGSKHLSNNKDTKLSKDKNLGQPSLSSDWMIDKNILHQKYVQRQIKVQHSEIIKRLIHNKNKVTTELRLLCSQKEYFSRLFTNSIAIIKLKSNHHGQVHNSEYKMCMMVQLITQPKIQKIIKDYRKSKLNIPTQITKEDFQRYVKQTPIISTALDDSEHCIKNLVQKIDNMIKTQSNPGINILNEYDEFNGTELRPKKIPEDFIFYNNGKRISQIMNKNKFLKTPAIQTPDDNLLRKKQMRKKLYNLQKILVTEPIYSNKLEQKILANTDEYGILSKPPRQVFFRRKRAWKQTDEKIERLNKTGSINSSNDSSKRSLKLTKRNKKQKIDVKPSDAKKKKKRQNSSQQCSYYKTKRQKKINPQDCSSKKKLKVNKIFY